MKHFAGFALLGLIGFYMVAVAIGYAVEHSPLMK